MAGNKQSKQKLLAIYDILYKKTDENHTISAEEIVKELESRGISAERKSIYKDVEELIEYGYEILYSRTGKKGWFMAVREFELPELCLLIDAVQSAGFISEKKTKLLTQKLRALTSEYLGNELGKKVYIDSGVKCQNEEIYYNIDKLYRAIGDGVQVEFNYIRRKLSDRMTTANDTKVFKVNPYALIWSNDHYYLVCNNVKYENLMHLRIDRIKKVEILDTKARSFTDFTPYTIRFNSADYAKRLFNMYSGEMRSVELRCDNSLIENIIDRFGEKTPIVRNDESTFILRTRVALSEGLVNWIMQFGEKIKIISPPELKEMYLEKIEKICKMYDI